MIETGDPADLALLLLRLYFGLMMVAHGLNHIFGGGRIEGASRWFESLGLRHGKLQAWAAALTECGAGLLLALGLLTPVAAAGFVGLLTVAIATHHRFHGFFIIKEGVEYVLAIMVVALALGLLGPGQWSIDDAVGFTDQVWLQGWWGGLIALSGALVAALQLAVFYRSPRQEVDST
ncbi:MAG: DoxX family protein [Actinobacteria bacterium ATB1]|nr:DoxX family protein [Actinobacteria bacterium ATB1]